MFTSQSCVFAVNYQARSLAPQKASKERHRFLVGTCSLHDSNELSVLEYHESSNQIEATAIYSHPDQIWSIEPSPNDSDLVITSGQSSSGEKHLNLWRMPHQNSKNIVINGTYLIKSWSWKGLNRVHHTKCEWQDSVLKGDFKFRTSQKLISRSSPHETNIEGLLGLYSTSLKYKKRIKN